MTDQAEKITGYLWLAFILSFLSNALGGTVSTLMSVYLPVVVRDLLGNVDEQRLNDVSAYINAIYIVGWTVGGLTWGVVSDRIGRRKSLALSIASFGIFAILTSFATSWEWVLVCRFFSGFGVGGVLVISATLLSEIFPAKYKAVFIGILSIGFPVGIFSSGLLGVLVPGWKQGFLMGLLPVILGVISYFLIKESEGWSREQSSKESVKQSLFDSENQGNLWKGAIIFGSMLIGLWALFLWMPTWVQSLLKDSDGQTERGISMMLLGIGGLTGGFFSGWISNLMGIRKAMMMCFAGCLVMAILLFKFNTSFSLIIYPEIALLALFFGVSQGLLSVYVPLLFPSSIRATATGFCFNIGRLFTAAAVFFVGAMVTTLGGYGNSLLTFSIVFLLGLITIYFTKEKN